MIDKAECIAEYSTSADLANDDSQSLKVLKIFNYEDTLEARQDDIEMRDDTTTNASPDQNVTNFK